MYNKLFKQKIIPSEVNILNVYTDTDKAGMNEYKRMEVALINSHHVKYGRKRFDIMLNNVNESKREKIKYNIYVAVFCNLYLRNNKIKKEDFLKKLNQYCKFNSQILTGLVDVTEEQIKTLKELQIINDSINK